MQHRSAPRARQLRPGGFTLVELLVVIGIIALLMGMLMPSLTKARAQAQSLACQANLRSVGQMIILYAQSNRDALFDPKKGGAYPPTERWYVPIFAGAVAPGGNPLPKIMLCPTDEETAQEEIDEAKKWGVPIEWIKHSYIINMHIHYDQIRYSRTHRVSATEIIVMGEKKSNWGDFRMNCPGPGQSQYTKLVENERHGKFRKSNLLFMDGHVGSQEPPQWIGPNGETMEDPWDILPGGKYDGD